jgi:transcriptional regulator with XRE-family HTH domain
MEQIARAGYDTGEVSMDQSATSRQLARRIRLLRGQRGWSAQQLADACAEVGMDSLTRATIAKIESGTRQSVTADEIVVLARVLRVSPASLLAAESAAEALFGALVDLSRQAGSPSVGELAQKLGLPRSALSDLFSGRTLPGWSTLEPVVHALGGDNAQFLELWRRASEGDDARLLSETAAGTQQVPRQREQAPWMDLLEGLRHPETQADPKNRKSFALTLLFLEIGLKMVDEDLGEGSGPGFGWRQISRERVVQGAMKLAKERQSDIDWGDVRSGLGAFKQRWALMADYLQDLVTYALYSPRWREALDFARAELLDGLEDVATGKKKFSDLIVAVAKKDMALRLRFARYLVFQLTLTVDSAYGRVAQKAQSQFYEVYSQSWVETYNEALKKLGFTLRPGVSVEVLGRLFGCLAEGLTVIVTQTGDDLLTKDENDNPLLAQGVMLMILGSIDTGANQSSQDGVDRLIR